MKLITKKWYVITTPKGNYQLGYGEFLLGFIQLYDHATPVGLPFNTFDSLERKRKVYGFSKLKFV